MPQPDEDVDFAAVLRQHNKGVAYAELCKALAEVTAACKKTGKKGSVSLTLSIEPQPKMGNVIKLTDSIRTKVPAPDRVGSMWYPDEQGGLHRNNPEQHELFGEQEVVSFSEPRHEPPVLRVAGTDPRTGTTHTEGQMFSDRAK